MQEYMLSAPLVGLGMGAGRRRLDGRSRPDDVVRFPPRLKPIRNGPGVAVKGVGQAFPFGRIGHESGPQPNRKPPACFLVVAAHSVRRAYIKTKESPNEQQNPSSRSCPKSLGFASSGGTNLVRKRLWA